MTSPLITALADGSHSSRKQSCDCYGCQSSI